MKGRSLEEVAREIFGAEDSESIERWIRYWSDSRERNRRLLEDFQKLALIDFTDRTVLDVGCGTGGLGEVIGEECLLYIGADYHFHVLQFARSDRRRTYLQCSGTDLPFPDESFDYVFSFDVIEHLIGGISWQRRFLEELRRVLRPLGMIFLTTPNFWCPREGHTDLYFPHYLPAALTDRYIAWRNPGFLREHRTFSEIRLLTPRQLRRCLESSGLSFLHELPCGLDRRQFARHFPFWGWMAYAGLGWYPHAEFWGILVRREARALLRLKLPENWRYEAGQPGMNHQSDFQSHIDFDTGLFAHQLATGWYWHERDRRGFRWIRREASCYLQSNGPVSYVRVSGYAPEVNRLDLVVNGLHVGGQEVTPGGIFEVEYLVPFLENRQEIFEVQLRCGRSFHAPADQRELGLMIFSVGLL